MLFSRIGMRLYLYKIEWKADVNMDRLEILLKNRPHWVFYIFAGVTLFAAVFNYQNGQVEEVPLYLGIALILGIIGVIVKKIWLKVLKAYETKEQQIERLELSVTTAFVCLIFNI